MSRRAARDDQISDDPKRLRFVLTRQEASISLSAPSPLFDKRKEPLSLMHDVRLYGTIIGSPKGKWKAGAVHIMPLANMMTSTKPIENFGYVDAKKGYVLIRVFWPVEYLPAILSLVAAHRITEVSITVSEYRIGADILGCSLETLGQDLWKEEFMYWVGGVGPQPIPQVYTEGDAMEKSPITPPRSDERQGDGEVTS